VHTLHHRRKRAAAAFLSSADIWPAAFFSGGFSAPSTFSAAAAKFSGWGVYGGDQR